MLTSEHSQSYRGDGMGGDDHGGGGGAVAGEGEGGGGRGPTEHCWAIATSWHAEKRAWVSARRGRGAREASESNGTG